MTNTVLSVATKGGNTLDIFFNPRQNVLRVVLMSKDGTGGSEIVGIVLDEGALLQHLNPVIDAEIVEDVTLAVFRVAH